MTDPVLESSREAAPAGDRPGGGDAAPPTGAGAASKPEQIPAEWRNCRFCGGGHLDILKTGVRKGVDIHQVACQNCGARGPRTNQGENAAAFYWLTLGREIPVAPAPALPLSTLQRLKRAAKMLVRGVG